MQKNAVRHDLPATFWLTGHRYRRLCPLLLAALLSLGWADSWQGFRTAAQSVNTIRAEFVQEKHLPILARPLISSGVFIYRRPDALRWEYRHPVRSILLVDGASAKRMIQSGGQMVEDRGAQLQSMAFVMSQIASWMSGRFEDNPLFAARLAEGPVVVLTPKDEAMARLIQRVVLHPSTQPGVLESVTVYESDDAFTRLTFHDTEVNIDLDADTFKDIP